MQIIVFYFLWNAAFTNNSSIFGYTKEKILTYALLLIMIRAITLSSRSVDVAGQISNGDLTNLLTKPVNFFSYWLSRDISSKILNITFAIFELMFLYILLAPSLFLQTNFLYLVFFVVSIILAIFIFFNIMMLTNFVPFWMPEVAWGAQFLVIVIVVEFLSGAIFPLDVFPDYIYNFLLLTPFPYLVFMPIQIYLGSLSTGAVIKGIFIAGLWSLILWKITNIVWRRGLKVFEGAGR